MNCVLICFEYFLLLSIKHRCGFSKVSHIDDIDRHFPELDVNDRQKRYRVVSQNDTTVDSRYLEHSVSRISRYLEQNVRSLAMNLH